jgi:sodium-type flagellar protein MotY
MNKIITLLISGVFASSAANAAYKTFEADISESTWQFEGTPLNCQLTHQVPYYGTASFQKSAGKKQQLGFQMSYKRQPLASVKVASVQSMSPSWLPNRPAKSLGELAIHSGQSIFKTKGLASWRLLNELEVGRFPMFRYQDFESLEDQVAVSLSAVGFKQPYAKFLNCLSSLVPFKLNELKQMTLRFDFAKHKVKQNYHQKLNALAAYIKYDPEVEVVFISGHTDSKGSRYYNHKLSERRITSVKTMLTLPGTSENRFKTIPHGERKPVATNRNASGRALNRRVYIRVD